MIANFEQVKSLVESSYMGDMDDAYVIPGPLCEDTLRECDIDIQESAVELAEFTCGANAIMIESAIAQDFDKVQVLQEASAQGIKDRISNLFKKIANFFKALAARFLAFVTAFLGMTKTWLKQNKKRVTDVTKSDYKYKMYDWNVTGIEAAGTVVNKDTFAGYGPDATVKAEWDNPTAEACKKVFGDSSGVTETKDIEKYVYKLAGAGKEKTEVLVINVRDELLSVIEKVPSMGKKVSDICRYMSKQAAANADAWKRKDTKGLSSDDAENIKKIASVCTQAQKVISVYAGKYQKMTKAAVHESMYALNGLAGKGNKDKK